jgi:TP901 family phage tail tape measure protein
MGIQFEDTFAGVAKTAEGIAVGFDEIAAAAKEKLGITITTMDEAKVAAAKLGMQFGDLTSTGKIVREEFRQLALDIPIPATELNKLGEIVGALGVKSQDIPYVTKLIAELGVATDISAQDAAFGLIRLGNILEGTSLDIVDFTNRAGSALVALGNASVSTEGEILQVALRLAAAGERAGFSEAQIFAWATTITDLGARAEAGGTAVSRALNEMVLAINTGDDSLNTFAQVAGLSVDAFVRLFKKDASGALDVFIKKLEEGIKTGRVNKDMLTAMGLGGVRAIDVIGRLGEAQGILGRNMETANQAWAEAIALQEEAEKRFQTVKSQIQILKNTFTDLGITIFDLVKDDIKAFIESIKDMLTWFKGLNDGTKRTILVFAAVAAAIGPLLIIAGSLISAAGTLITLFGALATPVGLVVTAVALLAATMGSLIGWENIFAAAQPILSNLHDQLTGILGMIGQLAPVAPAAPAAAAPHRAAAGREGAIEKSQQTTPLLSTNAAEQAQEQKAAAAEAAAGWIQFSAAVQTAMAVAQDTLKAFIDTIVELVGPEIQATVDTMTQTLADFGLDWGDVWEGIKQVIVIAAEVIGTILIILVGVIAGIATGIATALHTMSAVWREAAGFISGQVEGLIRIFAGLIGFVDNVLRGRWDAAILSLQEVWKGIGQVISNMVGFVVNTILGGLAIVLAFVYGFVTGIIKFFQNLYDNLIGHSIVPDIVDGILKAFGDLISLGPKLFDDFVNGVLDSANNLLSGIETTLGDLGGKVSGLFSGIFSGGGGAEAGVAGTGGGGGDFAAQFLLQIQNAIPLIQGAWSELMVTLSTTTMELLTVLSDTFLAFLTGLQANFVLVEAAWIAMVGILLAEISSLAIGTTTTFMLMGTAVTLFTGTAIAGFLLFSETTMGVMNLLQAYWLVIVQQMVHHWLDFVYATLALTAEWAATTQGELTKVGNAFVAASTSAQNAWNSAVVAMMAQTGALISQQGVAVSGFTGVGSAAGSAARAVEIAAARMIAAMKAVLAAVTGSPELKIQHPFEKMESYLQKTDFGELVDKSLSMPSISGNFNTVLPATAGGGNTSIDQSVNMGDVIGGPFQTQDDVLDTMTRFIRTRGTMGQ